MINDKTLVENLKDFCNIEKYSLKQLAEFLISNPITAVFYESHINEIKKSIRTIIKFSKDKEYFYQHPSNISYDLHYKYSNEELQIIRNILKKHLITFGIVELSKEEKGLDKYNGIRLIFYIDVLDDLENKIKDFIDYIIKFCPMPDNTHHKINTQSTIKLKYYSETDTFTLNGKTINLTNTELYTLKEICKPSNEQNIQLIFYKTVSNINTKATNITGQKLIKRKGKYKPYFLEDYINFS